MSSKSYIKLVLLAALLPWALSCSRDDVDAGSDGRRGCVTLYLSTDPTSTRATQVGEDPYNENKVDRVDLYFYADAESLDRPALFVAHNVAHGEYNAQKTINELTVRLSVSDVATLFPNTTTTCYVRAIVNGSESLINGLGDNPTVAALNAAKVAAPAEGNPEFKSAAAPAKFLMYSPAALELNKAADGTVASADGAPIKVRRVASKIRLAVKVEDKIYQDASDGTILAKEEDESDEAFEARMKELVAAKEAVKWTAVTDEMRVYISDAVSAARLDGYAGEHSSGNHSSLKEGSRWLTDGDYFSIEPSTGTGDNDGGNFAMSRPLSAGTEGGFQSWNAEYPYVMQVPFYSYPNIWANDRNEEHRTYLTVIVPWEMSDGTSTAVKYTSYQLPVNPSLADKFEGRDCLTSNTYYRILLHIGVLGSFEVDEPIEVEASYDIMDWGREDIGVDIASYRYLVVNQTDWTMNNAESITIPFYTSHEVVVKSVTISYDHFNDNTNGTVITHTITDSASAANDYRYDKATINAKTYEKAGAYWYTYDVDKTANTLTFTHSLDLWKGRYSRNTGTNNQPNWRDTDTDTDSQIEWFVKDGSEKAYMPFTITVVLVHKDKIGQADEQAFTETIVFTQYPPMYIAAVRNEGGNTSGNYTNFSRGYVSVNNKFNNVEFGSLGNLDGSNTNPNMYVISVTQLNEGENYIIGDPRTLDYNINLSNNSFSNTTTAHTRWSTNAPVWYSSRRGGGTNANPYVYTYINSMYEDEKPDNIGSNTTGTNNYTNNKNNICYYYPTDESSLTENMIAPKFRIASSWGTTQVMTREAARKRCATYQEQGRPAGRWRLPTKGEMAYIVGLSSMGRIPTLFSPSSSGNGGYWTAHGAHTFNTGNPTLIYVEKTTNGTASARCLYDEWYWVKEDGSEDTCPPEQFTWGDKLKINPQEHD